MNKNAIVITNGCPENRIDCAEIELLLIQNGWEITTAVDQANLIILNLCGVFNTTEEKSLDLIKQLTAKKKSNSRLLVTGCLPKINSDSIKSIFNGEIIKGHNLKEIAKLLGFEDISNSNSSNYLAPYRELPSTTQDKIKKIIKTGFDRYFILNRFQKPEYMKYWDKVNIVQPDTFYIKVASGCLHACAYCAVRLSRGTVKSKSIDDIKTQIMKGLEKGYSQFSFIGTDLGSYGKDIKIDLLTLLREIVSIDKKFKIRLRNVHPQLLINQLSEFLEIASTGKITHITSAVQHGNDRILELMKRNYNIKDCKSTINTIKNKCPNIQIRTQLMVGFPGETDSEFNDTLNLIDEIKFDFIEVYDFSPRIGTLAAKMPHHVSQKVINQRTYKTIKKTLEILKRR